MNIEKTYKLKIKDTEFNLTEEEVSALYDACRKSLNINYIGPIPSIPSKPFDNPIAPMYPSWPVYPGTGTNPIWHTPYVTGDGTNSIDNSVMDTNVFTTTWSDKDMSNHVKSFSTNIFNKPSSSTPINFISDDMTTVKENEKWRSIQNALDKLSAKTVVTTSEGIKVG